MEDRRKETILPETRPLTKVFGIGLHKTSTTSLANALYTLGYDVAGAFDTGALEGHGELEQYVLKTANEYDAVQDMPWPSFYRLLDEHFPGSKFVLTVRPPEPWIRSVVSHFGDLVIPSHEYTYGVPTASGHEVEYLDRYHRHNAEVRDYFADRPDDLLVMDITGGDGWDELCGHLGVPTPTWSFPRQNQIASRRTSRYRRYLRRRASAAGRRVGVPPHWLDGDRVDAATAYAAVHGLCRRIDAVAAAIEDLSLIHI